jgi:PAS domain S-box-containing protein
MYQNWKNNKNVIFVAVAMFLASVAAIMLISNPEGEEKHDSHELKADVISIVDFSNNEEKEQDYRKYLDYDGPFMVLGLDGIVKFASEDYESMTGYEEGELDKHMIFTNINPLDLPKLVASFGEVLASGTQKTMVGPYKIMNAEGEYKTHVATLYPIIQEEKVVEIAVMPRDISDVVIEEEGAGAEDVKDEVEVENKIPGKSIRNIQDIEDHRLADNNLV